MTQQDALLRKILTRTRTIAVVGLSDRITRPSNGVARYLQAVGYRVIPVNPVLAGREILGETVYADFASIPEDIGSIDMVDIFRRSEQAGAVVDDALRDLRDRDLSTIWMQIGVIDHAAAARAEAAGIDVIMDRCPKIDHPRLMR